jgi:membrane protease YdiL (CAAX protease family)
MSMPLGVTATGLILGWLWVRTGSLWLVAIAHASSNNWGQYAFKYMQDSVTPGRDLIALNLGSLALLIVDATLLWRRAEFTRGDSTAASKGGITRS